MTDALIIDLIAMSAAVKLVIANTVVTHKMAVIAFVITSRAVPSIALIAHALATNRLAMLTAFKNFHALSIILKFITAYTGIIARSSVISVIIKASASVAFLLTICAAL